MILKSLLVLLPSTLIGILLVNIILPSKGWMVFAYKLFLGIGAGLGITSCLYFIWLFIFPLGSYFFLFQIVLLLVLSALTFLTRKKKAVDIPVQKWTPNWVSFLLAGSAAFALGVYAYGLGRSALMNTHGDYDAQAVWNLRARFIHRLGEDWLTSFSPDLYWKFHADYPLLLPLNTVWAWRTLGEEIMRVPAVQAVYFAAGLIGLTFISTYLVRGAGSASLAVTALVATPLFVKLSFFQTADAPLTYYLLAALTLLYFYTQHKSSHLLTLAGLMSGLAAWTKNEGLLLAILMLGLAACATLLQRLPARHLLAGLAGLALPLAITGYFKLVIAPSNDLFAPADLLAKLLDPTRYLTIFKMLGKGILAFGEWPFSISITLCVYVLFMYSKPKQVEQTSIQVIGALLAVQLIGYLAIYLFTPHPLEWHLTYSLERLLFHFFPGVLFMVILFTHPPEQISKKVPYVTHH